MDRSSARIERGDRRRKSRRDAKSVAPVKENEGVVLCVRFCVSTVAMVVVGAASSGLAAIVVKKVRPHHDAETLTSQTKERRKCSRPRDSEWIIPRHLARDVHFRFPRPLRGLNGEDPCGSQFCYCSQLSIFDQI